MLRFRSAGNAQRFLSVQASILNLFNWGRHQLRAWEGIVKLTKSSLIDPQDTGLKPVANPPCLASETAVSPLTIPAGCLHADRRRSSIWMPGS